MRPLAVFVLAMAFLALSCNLVKPNPATPTPPAPENDPMELPWEDRSTFKPGLVQPAQGVLDGLPGATVYHLEYEIDADILNIKGHEQVFYTNNEEVPLSEVYLRLLPNLLGGEMEIQDLAVDEKPVTPRYSMNESLMTIPLEQALQPGESVSMSMDFTLSIPQSVELNYGVLAYAEGVLALAHSYAMVPVYNEEGWNAEVPPQHGDLTFTDMSFFIVKVTAPADLQLAAAGREVSRSEAGQEQVVTFAAGPVRDFYLAASRDYVVVRETAGETSVNFYVPNSILEGAREGARVAARTLDYFSQRYGVYPYTELDLVGTPTQALGIEYPGLLAITFWIIEPGHDYLEATVAHEVGHQWFYNLVGSDQLDQPWMDESLTQFVTLQYFSDEYGPQGERGFRSSLEARWDRVGREPIPIGLPVAGYTGEQYSAIIYGRGALFFDALRTEMGTEAFDAFMKDYVSRYAWEEATPAGLKSLAEEHCGCDLTGMWEEWVE